eukprot:scaffold24048_cov194-Amphora_coffeaeformis.AAC.4
MPAIRNAPARSAVSGAYLCVFQQQRNPSAARNACLGSLARANSKMTIPLVLFIFALKNLPIRSKIHEFRPSQQSMQVHATSKKYSPKRPN